MLATAGQVRAEAAEGRVGALSGFLADVCLLARSTCGVVGPVELADLASRLGEVGR